MIDIPKSRKKTTKWNLFFMYLQVAISIINGIVIVPLYLYYLKSDLYGAWLATGNLLVWFTVIDPGISDIAKQRIAFAYAKKEIKDIRYIVSSTILLHLLVGLIIFSAVFIIADQLPAILKLSSNIDQVALIDSFKIAGIGTALMLFGFSFNNLNFGLQSSLAIGIIWSIINVLGTALNIALLIEGFGLLSIAYASVFKGFFYVVGNATYLAWRVKKEKFGFGFSWDFLKSFSKIFSYTFISKISETISNNFDLILVARFIDTHTVTLLELTRRPIKVLQGFLTRPSAAMVPSLAHLFGENDLEKYKNILLRFFNLSNALNVLVIFGFITFNKSLNYLWLGPDMYIGNTINIIICVTFLISTTSYNLSNYVFSIGKIKEMSIITTIRSFTNLLLLVVMGKYLGLVGVALAPLAAYMVTEIWFYPKLISGFLSITKTEINQLIKVIGILFITAIVLTMLFSNIEIFNWITLILYCFLFTVLFIVAIYLVIPFFNYELKNLIKRD